MAFNPASLGGLGGGGEGRTAQSAAPVNISPVYGVSGANLGWILGGAAAVLGLIVLLAVMFGGKGKK